MKPVVLLLCVYALSSGCSAPPEKTVPQESVLTDTTEQETTAALPVETKPPVKGASVSGWVQRNLDVELPDSVFEAAGLTDTTLFTVDLTKFQREELFDIFFLGDKPLKEVTILPGVVRINLSESEIKYLFISANYVIVSCHLSMGNNGSSLLYNLKTRKLERLNMNVEGFLQPHVLDAWFDYYEEAHVWEYGTYDIRTKKFRRTRIER
jgi:hypothetical protein